MNFKKIGKQNSNMPTSMISSSSNGPQAHVMVFKKTKDAYCLDDFEVKARLGSGAFGSVYLVKLLENPDLVFAMKVIDK